MHSRLRSNDAVKRSCANVAGTVIISFVGVVVVVVVVVVDVVAFWFVVDVLRLTTLAQDIVSVIGRADDCLHYIQCHA